MALFQAHGRATLIDAGRITAISADRTLSNVKVARGGLLQPQDGVTITIASLCEIPGNFHWIDESQGGRVLFARGCGVRSIPPQWYGAAGDDETDDSVACGRALQETSRISLDESETHAWVSTLDWPVG